MELNKIYNEDYLVGLQKVQDKSIDTVITDPPYLFVKGGMKNDKWNIGKMSSDSYMNDKMSDFDETKINELLDSLAPKFKHGWNALFFCSELQIAYYLNYAVTHKLRYNVLIWDREVKSMISRKFFKSHIDYIVRIYGKGNSLNNVETDNKMDMYAKIRVGKQGNVTEHETEKPLNIITDFVQLLSNKGDTVLDPFMGSGTTAIACINTDRNFIGFEINEKYHNIANTRIQQTIYQKSIDY